MQTTVAFLLLGLCSCFVTADDQRVAGRQMLASQKDYYVRKVHYILYKLQSIEDCGCSGQQKIEREKCLVEDILITVRMLAMDYKIPLEELVDKLFGFVKDKVLILEALKANNIHTLTRALGGTVRVIAQNIKYVVPRLMSLVNCLVGSVGDTLSDLLRQLNIGSGNLLDLQNGLVGNLLSTVGSVPGLIQKVQDITGCLTNDVGSLLGGIIGG
ncbi:uncharacterized protein LOC116409725 [Xenopus tropicalis]|uniref:Uncharacterized protein LOC116409725 n=1 Tax=Xenopus tropicalis TaxID=8364 RepID=A0A8J1JA01_XENTR|nr:uncharacterized protein LOC116409725 [Xenopus tropicalis]